MSGLSLSLESYVFFPRLIPPKLLKTISQLSNSLQRPILLSTLLMILTYPVTHRLVTKSVNILPITDSYNNISNKTEGKN